MAIKAGDAVIELGLDKKKFDRDMKGLSGAINRHKKAIGLAMVGMGVAAVGAAAASIKAFADMGDEIHKMSIRTDFSTEALSELRHALELSGSDLGTLEKAVKKMAKTIVDADEGMATYIRSFDRIGVSAEELMKLSPEDQFKRITEAIAKLESPTLRAATAQDIFGRAGTALLPLMAEGAEGLAKLRQEAHDLGIVFDQEAAGSAALLKDNITRLKGAVAGLQFALAKELTPALEDLIPVLTEFAITFGPILATLLNWNKEWDRNTRLIAANRRVTLEHQRAVGGLTNEYKESIEALKKIYAQQGKLTPAVQDYIDLLEDEFIRVMGEAIDEVEELTEAERELGEEFNKTTGIVEDAIRALEYERSAAGQLNIRIDDVIQSLHLMGLTNEEITETLVLLGDEQGNVLKVLEAFGLTALEVADALDFQIDEVVRLADAYEGLSKATEAVLFPRPPTEAEQAVISAQYATGGTPIDQESAEFISAYALANPGSKVWGIPGAGRVQIGPGLYAAPLFEGGIAMKPMVAAIAERGPEAVIPLNKLEQLIGGRRVNIFVELDGATIARAIGQPLVDEIRLRTGVHI